MLNRRDLLKSAAIGSAGLAVTSAGAIAAEATIKSDASMTLNMANCPVGAMVSIINMGDGNLYIMGATKDVIVEPRGIAVHHSAIGTTVKS